MGFKDSGGKFSHNSEETQMVKKTAKPVIVSARSKVRTSDRKGKPTAPKTKKIKRTRSIERTIEEGR
jgi:hypothetical protein